MEELVTINQESGEPITQQDLDGWCNCSNFPYQKCDECKEIFYKYDEK
jgi:hypothetical protein